MKVAIVEVPYPCRLAVPLEKLGALEFSYLVKSDGYGSAMEFTTADPTEHIEIKVVDTSEIKPFEPKVAADPVSPPAPAPLDPEDDGRPF